MVCHHIQEKFHIPYSLTNIQAHWLFKFIKNLHHNSKNMDKLLLKLSETAQDLTLGRQKKNYMELRSVTSSLAN